MSERLRFLFLSFYLFCGAWAFGHSFARAQCPPESRMCGKDTLAFEALLSGIFWPLYVSTKFQTPEAAGEGVPLNHG
jgi:hypothetical protein